MKLLNVIATLDKKSGGPVAVVKSFAVALNDLGQQCEVVTLDEAHAPGVDDFPCIVHTLGPSWGKFRFNLRLVAWLMENAKRYDAVIVHGIWIYPSIATWLASRLAHFPYFIFVHGMLDPWFKREYPMKHLKKWLYWPWADYQVLRDAKGVLFTNVEERNLAQKSFWLYKANELVVNLGVPFPEGDPSALRQMFFDAYPSLRDKQLILFLGRIHPKKGCDLMVEAFGHIATQYPDVCLVVAGPDQEGWQAKLMERALQINLSERIIWTGMLNGDLKWGAFHAADVFILPSHSENFGIAVAESLSCGLPVLITDKVNIWREIAEDNAGYIRADTLEGVKDLLQQWFLMSAEEKQVLRKNARMCFENRFESNKVAKNLIETISTIKETDASYNA